MASQADPTPAKARVVWGDATRGQASLIIHGEALELLGLACSEQSTMPSQTDLIRAEASAQTRREVRIGSGQAQLSSCHGPAHGTRTGWKTILIVSNILYIYTRQIYPHVATDYRYQISIIIHALILYLYVSKSCTEGWLSTIHRSMPIVVVFFFQVLVPWSLPFTHILK